MLTTLLFYIPATLVCNYVVLRVLGVDYNTRKLWVFAFLQGVMLYILRNVVGAMGWHIVIQTVSHTVLFYYLLKIPILMAMLVKAIGFMLVMFGEVTIGPIVLRYYHLTLTEALAIPWVQATTGWLVYLPTVLIALGFVVMDYIKGRRKEGDLQIEETNSI